MCPVPSASDPCEVLYRGSYSQFVRRGTWEYVQRLAGRGAVAIIPVTDDGRLVLVEQFRPPMGKHCVELPAGLVGDIPGKDDEPVVHAARRELLEETGYEADRVEVVAEGPASPGISSSVLAVALATGLRKTGPGGGDETEDILLHEIHVDHLLGWLDAQSAHDKLIDLKIYMGLYFIQAHNAPLR